MEPAGRARIERRLAAILAADVAGYSRLIGADEEGTLARLKAHRHELIDPKIAEHRGRMVKTTGDGLLAEFATVVGASKVLGLCRITDPSMARRCRIGAERARRGRHATYHLRCDDPIRHDAVFDPVQQHARPAEATGDIRSGATAVRFRGLGCDTEIANNRWSRRPGLSRGPSAHGLDPWASTSS